MPVAEARVERDGGEPFTGIRARPREKQSSTKGPGRPKGRFTQQRRMDALREALEAHAMGLSVVDLATRLRMTPRSVRRYLAELARHVDVEAVPARRGGPNLWRIRPGERSRSVSLRRLQAYGILATRSLFDGLRGSAFFEELDALYSDIRAVAHRPTRPSMRGEAPHDGRLEERLVVHVPMAKHYRDRAEQLDMVVEGLRDNCALHIRLVRPAPFDSAKVTLEPYALVTHQAEVHCIGRDVVTNQVRVLRLDEVAEVVVAAEQRFVLPQDFDVRAYLDGVCGVVAPGPRTEVLLEFDAQVAERIRHCRIHPTQRVAIARDGRMRISMAVSNLDALLSWLLSFGPQAKVVEPPAVADALRHRLEATLSRYAPRPA